MIQTGRQLFQRKIREKRSDVEESTKKRSVKVAEVSEVIEQAEAPAEQA